MNFSKIKRYFIIITLAGFIFSSLHFYFNTFLLPSFLLKEIVAKPVDAIIVPGVQYNGLKWNTVMKWRVYWSVYLYKKGLAKNIIYSGSAVYSPYTEATIMSLYAEKMGVPKSHGCIRMHNVDVIKLAKWIKSGVKVFVDAHRPILREFIQS